MHNPSKAGSRHSTVTLQAELFPLLPTLQVNRTAAAAIRKDFFSFNGKENGGRMRKFQVDEWLLQLRIYANKLTSVVQPFFSIIAFQTLH